MKKPKTLSKSKLMGGFQCEKNLYLSIFEPELSAEVDPGTQARFDEGTEIGIQAQKRFPEGILIEAEHWETDRAVKSTNEAINSGTLTLFEATFCSDGFLARVDILTRKNTKSHWKLIEVKSSTEVKELHITDVTIQTWIARKSGAKIESCHLMHINNQCVAPDLKDLFVTKDITDEVIDATAEVEKEMKSLKRMIDSGKEPKKDIGPHCTVPYDCPFIEHCWEKIPTPSAFDIPRIGKKAWELYEAGTIEIKKLNESDFNAKQSRVIKAHKSGKRFVDDKGIATYLKDWKWPIYFLDFETINPAIPLYDGSRPYQKIPFQFSCHVLEKQGAIPKHFEYLHTDSTDPREPLARELVENIGGIGSVVAYNKSFESGVLTELANQFPKYKKKLLSIAERLVDPLPILTATVYDKEFLSSFSLKSVAPVLLGKHMDYEGLEISEGGSASLAYLNLIKGKLSKGERNKIIQAMLQYCRQDTMATVELINWLYKEIS